MDNPYITLTMQRLRLRLTYVVLLEQNLAQPSLQQLYHSLNTTLDNLYHYNIATTTNFSAVSEEINILYSN